MESKSVKKAKEDLRKALSSDGQKLPSSKLQKKYEDGYKRSDWSKGGK